MFLYSLPHRLKQLRPLMATNRTSKVQQGKCSQPNYLSPYLSPCIIPPLHDYHNYTLICHLPPSRDSPSVMSLSLVCPTYIKAFPTYYLSPYGTISPHMYSPLVLIFTPSYITYTSPVIIHTFRFLPA